MDSDNDLDDFLDDIDSGFALTTTSDVSKRIKGRIAAEEAPQDSSEKSAATKQASTHGLRRSRRSIKEMTAFLGDMIPKQRIEIEANFDIRSLLTPSKYTPPSLSACSTNNVENDKREENRADKSSKKRKKHHSPSITLQRLQDTVLHSLQAWSANHKYYTFPSRNATNLQAILAPQTSLSRAVSNRGYGGSHAGSNTLTTANIRKMLNVHTLWSHNTLSRSLDENDLFVGFKKYRLLWLEALHHCWDQVLDRKMSFFYLLGQTDRGIADQGKGNSGVYNSNNSGTSTSSGGNMASLAGMVCASEYVNGWLHQREKGTGNDDDDDDDGNGGNGDHDIGDYGDGGNRYDDSISLLLMGASKQLLSRLQCQHVHYEIITSSSSTEFNKSESMNNNKNNSRYNPVSVFERREGSQDGYTVLITSNKHVSMGMDVISEAMFGFADHDAALIGSKSTLELPRILAQQPFMNGYESYMVVAPDVDAIQCKELAAPRPGPSTGGQNESTSTSKEGNKDGSSSSSSRSSTVSTHRIKFVGDLLPHSVAYLTASLIALAHLAEYLEKDTAASGGGGGNDGNGNGGNGGNGGNDGGGREGGSSGRGGKQPRRALTPVPMPASGRDMLLHSLAHKYAKVRTEVDSTGTGNDGKSGKSGSNSNKKDVAVTAVAPFLLETSSVIREKESESILESRQAMHRKNTLLGDMNKDLPTRVRAHVDSLIRKKAERAAKEEEKYGFRGQFGGLESEEVSAYLERDGEEGDGGGNDDDDDDDGDGNDDDIDEDDSDEDEEEDDSTDDEACTLHNGYKVFSIRFASSQRLDKLSSLPDKWSDDYSSNQSSSKSSSKSSSSSSSSSRVNDKDRRAKKAEDGATEGASTAAHDGKEGNEGELRGTHRKLQEVLYIRVPPAGAGKKSASDTPGYTPGGHGPGSEGAHEGVCLEEEKVYLTYREASRSTFLPPSMVK